MHILIAPGGFKESLSSAELAQAMQRGVKRVLPQAQTTLLPLTDGGEGFTQTLVEATGGRIFRCSVVGPVGQRVEAHYGVLGDGETGVLEMAAAAGLRLVPKAQRNPLRTTTYGVGQLIRALLEKPQIKRILIGCGDSGTNDGGMGMAQALGVRFLDAEGFELEFGGGALVNLAEIDLSGLHPRVGQVEVVAACNIHNLLLGERGVARVFGPQKGATPEIVETLELGLARLAYHLLKQQGIYYGDLPGSGASGGLGTGLMAFLGATLKPWTEVVGPLVGLEQHLRKADLVITGEGRLDATTLTGKVPHWVAQQARALGKPVLALGGSLGPGWQNLHQQGLDWVGSILPYPASLEEAMQRAEDWAADAIAQAMRLLELGKVLAQQPLAHEAMVLR
ncbi:glycerate kinase [Meiothermus rufus]|uniref:glycerate kinase n=1 Tax=Meiothermus rufus TaxID=604332 RepID=UPI00041A8007|nr:glycerate kinase [Meiothermus rufus]